MNRQALRTWGILFIVLGIVGQCVVQNSLLGIQGLSGQGLYDAMNASPEKMTMVTIAIVLQGLSACAVPIFAFMLVEGFKHTSNFRNYFLRVAGLAVISEIPYDFAMSGKVLEMNMQNPVFGVALALAMLYLFSRYPEKNAKSIAIKAAVMICAVVWVEILNIADGAAVVIVSAALWLLWKQSTYRIFGGCVAMFICMLFSPYYLAAPITFLAVHFYNGEPGNGNRWVNYLAYPVLLTAIALLAKYGPMLF